MNTAVVTGATSGIGFVVSVALANEGWRVLLVGHTPERSEWALSELKARVPMAEAACFHADLMQQRQVRRLADDLTAYLNAHCDGRMEALVNNAGAVRRWYATTCEPAPYDRHAKNVADQKRLYKLSEKLCGLTA